MFIRPTYIKSKGKKLAYWTLVESYRTAQGPRQRIIAYLGKLKETKRKGIKQAACSNKPDWIQTQLFDDNNIEPEWIEVNANGVRVENEKAFGGPWIAMELVKLLGLDDFLKQHLPPGEEQISWSLTSLILVICRLLNPSSELHIAEHYYKSTALSDLLGVPDERVNDDRLYRGLDKLLPHKDALETYLKNKLGTLFNLDFDILLYDVTSTYFEGEWSCRDFLDEKGVVANLGIVIGGLLSFADEHNGLVCGGFMASVCSTDGGGGGISY